MNRVDAASAIEPVLADSRAVFAEIAEMLRKILDEYGVDQIEITMTSTFHEDLEMESIDLVALAGRLAERYGTAVNFAEFIADMDLDEIIGLQVGRLVDYVVAALGTTPAE